jgi:DHA1 family tetracycline resistance protein-like MFS transporter
MFLSNLAQVSLPSTVVLYATHRYGWSSQSVGITLALCGVALIVVQAGLVGRFVAWFGNRATLIVGLLFGVAGLWIAGLAPTGRAFWFGIPVIALWGISGAAGQGLMTSRVSASEQGQLQGAIASLTGISELVGPSVFTLTFAYSIQRGMPLEMAGSPFLLAGSILLLASILAWMATRPRPH